MKIRTSYVVIFLGLACAIIYSQVWHYGLLTGDDNFNIRYNPFFHPPNAENILNIWSNFYLKLYIPVTLTTWALLRKAALAMAVAPEESLFHLVNVLLHWLNGILVYFLVRDVLPQQRPGQTSYQRRNLAALLGALLFVCHPLQAGTVAWITGLKDVLSASFGLLTLHAMLRADARLVICEGQGSFELRRWGWYLAASAAFALAVLSKPNMIVLPILAAVLSRVAKKDWRGCLVATVPWLAAGVVLTLATAKYQAEMSPDAIAPLWVRPFAALDAILFYLEKLIVPYPLVHEYAGRLIEVRRHAAPFWLSAAVSATLLFVFWRLRRRLPNFCAALLFSIVALLPILGFVPYSHQQLCDVSNHYMYFAMVGISLSFAAFIQAINGPRPLLVAVALTLIFGALSYEKTQVFANDEVFYAEMLREDPGSHFASGNLVVSLLRREKFEKALTMARADYQINPSSRFSLGRLAETLLTLGRGAEAVQLYNGHMVVYGQTPDLHFELGHILIIIGVDWQAGVRELLNAEHHQPSLNQSDPPNFIGEYLDLRPVKANEMAALLNASKAAPQFKSLQMLLKLLNEKTH